MFTSTVLSAIAYTSSSYDIGITPKTLEDIENGVYEDANDFNSSLRDFYKGWLNHNKNVGSFNSYLVTFSIILTLDAIVLFGGGVVTELSADLEPFSTYLLLVCIAVLVLTDLLIYFSELIYIVIYGNNGS